MSQSTVDAIVIGAGNHGLVAAALLADAGWDVLVLEGRSKPGGAVASRTIDGFVVDGAPAAVKEGVTQEEADSIKAQLEEAGAGVELK